MLHLGDITKISGYTAPIVDCVVFGAPCQDISVAGLRKGMKHESMGDDETTRSGLFHEAIRIIKEMRERDEANGRTDELIRPRYAVYENVPGAFSSNKAEDFRVVLEEIAKVADKNAVIPEPPKGKWTTSGCIVGDGWSIAWRVLDAQFWGLTYYLDNRGILRLGTPQRRRRIALVADFGGQSATEILFVRKGLSRNTDESRAQRQGASSDPKGSLGIYDRERGQAPIGCDVYNLAETGNKACSLTSGYTSTGTCPKVMMPLTDKCDDIAFDRSAYNQGKNAQYDIGIDENGIAHSLVAKGPGGVCYAVDMGGGKSSVDIHEDRSPTLTTTHYGEPAVCYGNNVVRTRYIVRRLTPLECERLQGFPDGWTDIGEWVDAKGKVRQTSDAARYKALGNSICLPPWKWVLKRLCAQYERDATMASLFSGIGGFDLLWEQLNGKGTCLWASEIEDFPIAVTKVRIGE